MVDRKTRGKQAKAFKSAENPGLYHGNVFTSSYPVITTANGVYRNESHCQRHYWAEKRFQPGVITAMNEALDKFKICLSPRSISLVGYSGDGGVVHLLATKRKDLQRVITVAGNLDTTAWTQQLNLSPLVGPLNPAEYGHQLTAVKRIHRVGATRPCQNPLRIAVKQKSR